MACANCPTNKCAGVASDLNFPTPTKTLPQQKPKATPFSPWAAVRPKPQSSRETDKSLHQLRTAMQPRQPRWNGRGRNKWNDRPHLRRASSWIHHRQHSACQLRTCEMLKEILSRCQRFIGMLKFGLFVDGVSDVALSVHVCTFQQHTFQNKHQHIPR